MPACGLWPSPRGLVAVLPGPRDRPRPPITVARTDEARWGLVHLLAAGGIELVLTDALARRDPIADLALHHGVPVWLAPSALAGALCRAAAVASPKASAALLSRLPAIPHLRAQLRRLVPPLDDLQLRLL